MPDLPCHHVELELRAQVRRGDRRHVPLTDIQLSGLYERAVYLLLRGEAPADAAGWAHAVRLLDEHQLFRMAQLVDDPHPFVPLLQLIVRLHARAGSPELRAAVVHLQSIGHSLLDAQGCSKIHPRDMINRPLPIVSAMFDVFGPL